MKVPQANQAALEAAAKRMGEDLIPGNCSEHGPGYGARMPRVPGRPIEYKCTVCLEAEVAQNTKDVPESERIALPGWNEEP